MSAPLLEVRDLCTYFTPSARAFTRRSRAPVRAVDGVSFRIPHGASLGLVGESGCGKSTIARTLMGLEPATSGSMQLGEIELNGLPARRWMPIRRRMQMVFQDPFDALDPRQTVSQILREPLQLHRIGTRRERMGRAIRLLESVGLGARHMNRYSHEFSGGQLQRIGIARALALEPELLLLDEPVSALDQSIRAQIINLLNELRRTMGLSYLVISHDLGVIRQLCDYIAVMYLGRVVEIAPRDELFTAPRHPYTQALLSAVPVQDPRVEAARQRIVLSGEVPSPSAPPAGCHFHTRCHRRDEVAGERCKLEAPELAAIPGVPSHSCACHLTTPPA